ncbi:MAG: PDZ domain-containing protein [Armatimonadetes bacterium]|nr:PDZ domain-containing protein [Armatimonadota bacterium]
MLLLIGLGYGLLAWWLSGPPPALAKAAATGLHARLVAVTREPTHHYVYQPGGGFLRHLLGARGQRLGPPAIAAQADVPDPSVVLWIWTDQPTPRPPGTAEVLDEGHRRYVNGALTQPIRAGALPWGHGGLVWVALTNLDRTATRLTFDLQLGGPGQSVSFTVPGPIESPNPAAASAAYPLAAGDRDAAVLLHQLRPVEPAQMIELLSLDQAPEPHDQLLLADFTAREAGQAELTGEWQFKVLQAVTERGERLDTVADHAGLLYLTSGRRPDGFDRLYLTVQADRIERGAAASLFRRLKLPAKPGDVASWNRDAAPPFRAAKLTCLQGARVDAATLRLSLECRAPPGSDVVLSYLAGLDQESHAVRPGRDGVELLEKQSSPGGVTWRWSVDTSLDGDATDAAFAFQLRYRAVAATTTALLAAKLQPPRPPERLAGLGVVLQPVRGRYLVALVTPGSGAAAAGLKAGDEILAVDGLPPALLLRAVLRHEPGQRVPVRCRRGQAVGTVGVALDALVPAQR